MQRFAPEVREQFPKLEELFDGHSRGDRQVMLDARERLAEEVRRSAVFGKSGWMSFIAGALGGAVAGAAGGAPAAAAGAAGAGNITRRALGARPAETAESRHPVLFRRGPR